MAPNLSNPKTVAELGERIYRERYKNLFEQEHPGWFAAIDVTTERAYVAEYSEGALETASKAAPRGIFHLVQIGHTGAFRLSYAHHTSVDWLFR